MAVGGLIAVLSGLCTGFFEYITIAGELESKSDPQHRFLISSLLFPLRFGGAPILIGLGLTFWGWRIVRRLPREAAR